MCEGWTFVDVRVVVEEGFACEPIDRRMRLREAALADMYKAV